MNISPPPSHDSSTAALAPRARTDDGLIWLVLIRGGISRRRMLRFLLGLDGGRFVGMAEVETVPVRAVRFQPADGEEEEGEGEGEGDRRTGRLTVDGELVRYEPFHAEILPGHLRILR